MQTKEKGIKLENIRKLREMDNMKITAVRRKIKGTKKDMCGKIKQRIKRYK